MAKYIPSIPIQDCYGSVGDVTFFHRGDQCFYKKRQKPGFPGTMAQMEHQTVHLRAIAAWQGLDPVTQKKWNDIAPGVIVHRPPYDGTTHMSGYNLFVSAYHGFATLNREHVPDPVPWEEFPVYAVDSVDNVAVEDSLLQLGFRVRMEEGIPGDRFRLLVRLQLAKPGGGRDNGKMRNYLAEGFLSAGDSVATVRVEDYRDIWDLDLPAYQVHIRTVLLDSSSGYRTIWRPASFLVNLP